MSKIFISYRRGDSAGHAGRLFDSLREAFGHEQVFMDVSGDIEPGVDFGTTIETAVGSCEILIVMIGPGWLDATHPDGGRRLEDPEDWVRLEVATALRRDVRVVPVLVNGARVPDADALPADLKALVRRNAIELSETRWNYDVQTLVTTLRKVLGEEEKTPSAWIPWAAAAAAVTLAVIVAWWRWPDKPPEVPVPSLVGMSFEAARDELEQLSLVAHKVEERSADHPDGQVFAQDPEAGTRLPERSTIRLTVARWPEVEVPDLVGKTLQEAEDDLGERSLTAEVVEKESMSYLEGKVFHQSPKAGDRLPQGSEIELQVARYPVSEDTSNQISRSYFCARKDELRCTQPVVDSILLSDLPLEEIEAGKPIRVLYFLSVAQLTDDLEFALHVWNRDVQGAGLARQDCRTVISESINASTDQALVKNALEPMGPAVGVAGATDCLIVTMPVWASPEFRHFSKRSVPGPGLYSAEVQDISRKRLRGSERRTIRVVADPVVATQGGSSAAPSDGTPTVSRR